MASNSFRCGITCKTIGGLATCTHGIVSGPRMKRNALFVAQCLADTDAALSRLFEAFPNIDAMQICVSELDSEQRIMTGTVFRTALDRVPAGLSTGMRLRTIGITYHSAGSEFGVMDSNCVTQYPSFSSRSPAFRPVYSGGQEVGAENPSPRVMPAHAQREARRTEPTLR